MFNEKKIASAGTRTRVSLISSKSAVDLSTTETECRSEFNCDFFSLNVLLYNRAQLTLTFVVLAFNGYARSVSVLDFRKLI